MRRRAPDNADTRLFLSQAFRTAERAGLPRNCAQLLLYVSAQPGGRLAYAEAMEKCELTEGQMERAVRQLTAMGYLDSFNDAEDRRRTLLVTTEEGESVVGHISTPK